MKREGAKTIAEILLELISENGLNEGFQRIKIFKAWDLVVGEKYANATANKFYKDKILYCTISSSMLRSQLYIKKANVIKELNSMLGNIYIKDIVLR